MSLTPVQIEQKLTALVSELTRAQQQLAESRDLEVAAEVAYRRAQDTVAESAPVVKRGEVTVAEREEWIDRATRSEWEAYRRATARRENWQDYLRVVRDQAEVVRSLGASVRTAYEMAGVGQ